MTGNFALKALFATSRMETGQSLYRRTASLQRQPTETPKHSFSKKIRSIPFPSLVISFMPSAPASTPQATIHGLTNAIWQIGNDYLWNRFEKKDWGNILLPYILLRRMDLEWAERYNAGKKKGKTDAALIAQYQNTKFSNSWAVSGKSLDSIIKGNALSIFQELTQYINASTTMPKTSSRRSISSNGWTSSTARAPWWTF